MATKHGCANYNFHNDGEQATFQVVSAGENMSHAKRLTDHLDESILELKRYAVALIISLMMITAVLWQYRILRLSINPIFLGQ